MRLHHTHPHQVFLAHGPLLLTAFQAWSAAAPDFDCNRSPPRTPGQHANDASHRRIR
jgi:hypothetical protein